MLRGNWPFGQTRGLSLHGVCLGWQFGRQVTGIIHGKQYGLIELLSLSHAQRPPTTRIISVSIQLLPLLLQFALEFRVILEIEYATTWYTLRAEADVTG